MKLRRATLSDDAYGAVRTMLLDPQRFAPGSKISIEELARELGVSRSPVWSAISRLEAEGLVRVEPRRGVFRIGFDPDKLRTLFETREALESFASRLAAERMTESELDDAARNLAGQRAALRRKSVDDYSTATLAFHAAITAGARNPMIARLLASIYDQVHAICGGRSAAIGWPGRAANIEDHAALLDRLRRRDGDGAEQVARTHAQRLAAGVFNAMGTEASA